MNLFTRLAALVGIGWLVRQPARHTKVEIGARVRITSEWGGGLEFIGATGVIESGSADDRWIIKLDKPVKGSYGSLYRTASAKYAKSIELV